MENYAETLALPAPAPSLNPAAAGIFGHPPSLFILFFTEMWERFSYYGMRALLVLFLVTASGQGGWGWSRAEALQLYGWYTGLVYFTPLLGGYLADRWLGSRKAVALGGLIIATGHACLLLERTSAFFIGLSLIVLGTGLFKPNISVLVGRLYDKKNEALRDAGYTLFYMGVNSGAFLGTLLCGYLGEKISWSLGFGLAGLFMLLGTMQFYFSSHMFASEADTAARSHLTAQEASPAVVADRLKIVYLLSFFTIFFWFAYEQAGGSMTIFASAYTDRVLDVEGGQIFKTVNTLMSVVPAMILTWVMGKLLLNSGRNFPLASLFMVCCQSLVLALLVWMLRREFNADQVSVPASWFGALPAFFIVLFAPLFSRVWERYWRPNGPIKFGLGLLLLGMGFAVLAYGALGIPSGARTASVSMKYLVLAYWFHTMGELCVSPVGLSLISKLAPPRLLGFMFGVWFLNTAIAVKLAGLAGSYIDHISSAWSMSSFFLIFAIIPALAGLLVIILNKWMSKKMHGIS